MNILIKDKKTRTILYFLKKYRVLWFTVIISALIVAFMESLNLAAIIPVLNFIFGITAAKTDANPVIRFITYIIYYLPIQDKVLGAVLLLLTVTLLKGILRVIGEWVISYASGKVLYDTKRDLMKKLAERDYKYFLDTKQGEIGYYVLTATNNVGRLILVSSQMVSELIMISSILILLFVLNVYATLVCVVIGVFFSILIGFIAKHISYILGKERMEMAAGQGVTFNEFFNGIKQIMIFGVKNSWLSKFDRFNALFTKLYIKDFVWLCMPTNIIEIFGMSALLGAFLILRTRFDSNMISFVPLTGAFAMSLLKILPALGTVSRARMQVVGSLPDSEVIVDILSAETKKEWAGKKEFKTFNNSIEFDRASFTYGGGKTLLDNVSFSIMKNKITAIVGSSGVGKTTVINLLLGLFAPSTGKILIDGIDMTEYDIDTFRKKVALVSQDTFIFHSTISDNIAFGSDKFSEAEIIKAAQLADLHEFIVSLKDGYNTIVGERGMKLSGGQQQRIAIARALIRKPEILILDEATSALDTKSEEQIYNVISSLMHKYTIIVIAHRLSTIKGADKIIVLDKGRVSEEGRHEELLRKGSVYYSLYNSWS